MKVILKSPCGREFEIAPISREKFNIDYLAGVREAYAAKKMEGMQLEQKISVAPTSAYDHYKDSNGYHEWTEFSIEWLSECQIVVIATEEEFLN